MRDSNAWVYAPQIALHRDRQSLSDAEHQKILGMLESSHATGQRILSLRDQVFSGQKINTSEQRAVGHWALRLASAQRRSTQWPESLPRRFCPDDVDLLPRFATEDQHVAAFAESVRSGTARSGCGKAFTSIVHLGIGGSDLGPKLLIDALAAHAEHAPITAWFLSNLDYHAVQHCLAGLDPQTTLVVMVSKSFSTQETLHNAEHLLQWMRRAGVPKPADHFVAVTNRLELAAQWGIPGHQRFWFDESIGGRFSLWGPVSLTARIVLGNQVMDDVLDGGLEMDQHFLTSALHHNMPAVLAATDFYNLRERDIPTLMVSAYDSRLGLLVPYLKQLWMESLGKHVDHQGRPINGPACPILWGDIGTNAQHAFFQLLHQGGQGVAIDLIGTVRPEHEAVESHQALLAHLVAQAQALSTGYQSDNPNRVCWGGHPVHLFMLERLNAKSLGALICLWEHRVLCLAALTGVNPFDQWGVEIGKAIAASAFEALQDASTEPDTTRPVHITGRTSSDTNPLAIDATSASIIRWIQQQ
jgi:glucose-6-phosphate isomerase